jgi:hypothetical protein
MTEFSSSSNSSLITTPIAPQPKCILQKVSLPALHKVKNAILKKLQDLSKTHKRVNIDQLQL